MSKLLHTSWTNWWCDNK